MLIRVLVGIVIGGAAGAGLTHAVLADEAVRVWLVNLSSLSVWGGAVLTGITGAAVAPRRFELPVAIFPVLLGSLGGLLWFGSSLAFSLADLGNILSLGGAFLKSGLWLVILAAIGGWIVAGIRSRIDETKGVAGAGGQYPPRSYR